MAGNVMAKPQLGSSIRMNVEQSLHKTAPLQI